MSLKVAPSGQHDDLHLRDKKRKYREVKSLVQDGTTRKW